MNDEPDKREGKNPKQDPRQDPRQDRLKLALRENLKRRKSQARGRSGTTAAPSEHDDPSPHEPGGKAE
jgi:hypothetical protein